MRGLIFKAAAAAIVLFFAGRGLGTFFAETKPKEKEGSSVMAESEIMEKVVPTMASNEAGGVQMPQAAVADEERQRAVQLYQASPELLVLVNKEHVLAEDYDAALRNICNKRLKASDRLYADLARMLDDASGAGHSFWIASAYRSRQRQQALIDEDVRKFKKQGMSEEEALAKTLEETMPAGHSEHETGLALDILDSNNMKMDQSQETYAGNQWLREHCYEYGFILRYPKEKEAITLISYEPWHFRYVGVEAAAFMKEHGLTLEEFYKILE